VHVKSIANGDEVTDGMHICIFQLHGYSHIQLKVVSVYRFY